MLNNKELKKELLTHIIETLERFDQVEELHYHAFNENCYTIGRYNAEQWLNKYNIGIFDAISCVQQYELENFGEVQVELDAESVVNMLVYILGEELLADFDLEVTKEDLLYTLAIELKELGL